jgi:hypothetical protein
VIENALVFALGALATAILALVVMPAFTRRAARLARRDFERTMPRTMEEMAAMRDGVRAEYAARTARVQAALDAANQSLMEERLSKADMSVQLAALRSERRAYQATMSEAETRITAAFSDLRAREEALAQAAIEKRELQRQIARLEERLSTGGSARPSPGPDGEVRDTEALFPDLADDGAVVRDTETAVAPGGVQTFGAGSDADQAPVDVPTIAVPALAIEPVDRLDTVAVVAPSVVATVSPEAVPVPVDVLPEPTVAEATIAQRVSAAGSESATVADAAPSVEDERATARTPSAPQRPEPLKPVATIPPEVAAAIAERLRSARDMALTGPGRDRTDEPAATLPQVAPWSVTLPPPEPDAESDRDGEPPPEPASKPRKSRRPGIARIAKSVPATVDEKPLKARPGTFGSSSAAERIEPPLVSIATAEPKGDAPARARGPVRMEVQPAPQDPDMPDERVAADVPQDVGSEQRPVPVVRRPGGAPPPAGSGEAAPEPFDPIANLPPRSTDPARATFQFPAIAVPAQADDDDELEPEERTRRIANLTRRLKGLRLRGPASSDSDDGAPPAASGSN